MRTSKANDLSPIKKPTNPPMQKIEKKQPILKKMMMRRLGVNIMFEKTRATPHLSLRQDLLKVKRFDGLDIDG